MSNLTLHYGIPSRGLVVHWMLEEVGRPYERRIYDIPGGELQNPEFLALNPLGRVPVLEHGDVVVTETTAICLYLADAFPEAGLTVPIDSPLRGELLRWLFFNPGSLEVAVLGQTVGFKSEDYKPASDIHEVAEMLAGVLRDRRFLVGDAFSVADVALGSGIHWAMNLIGVMPKRPELVSYWAGLEQRPGWQAVAATMAG